MSPCLNKHANIEWQKSTRARYFSDDVRIVANVAIEYVALIIHA